MSKNQNTVANPIRMDSRKFLGCINESVQAKEALFEGKVAEMGAAIGKNWKLASLRIKQINRDNQFNGDIFIEDVDTSEYYKADYRREKGGKVVIENIVKIELIEEEKQAIFENSCLQLVNAIESNNQQGMLAAFDKMASQRFSGKIVPEHGIVRTKDGVARKLKINDGSSLNLESKQQIVQYITESLSDKVIVENGGALSCSFNDGIPIRLPVTKWASKKLIGKRMKDAAINAYQSPGFQNRIYEAAQLVYDNKIEEAVKLMAPFLKENEEFTLLKRNEVKELVENALATKACFNQSLCENTATLVYKTNMKVNRDTILREWKKIAVSAEHSTLLENVQKLSQAQNFMAAHDKFLEMIFEAVSNREATAEALATTLDVLKNRTPKIKESHNLSSRLNDLIGRLRDRPYDDSSIYEAEDLIATIQEELSANENLRDFDSIPGDDDFGGDFGDEMSEEDNDLDVEEPKGQQQPQIVINSPLIQIGGTSGGGDTGLGDDLGGDLGGDLGDDLGGDEGEDEFDLGGGEDEMLQGGSGGGDEMGGGLDLGESIDPYAFKSSSNRTMADYGQPVITNRKVLTQLTTVMGRLAEDNNIDATTINENLVELAKAAIETVGINVAPQAMNRAIMQLSDAFMESKKPWKKPWADDDSDDSEECDDGSCEDDGSDDNPFAEDQYKGPNYKKSGYGKSSINRLAESAYEDECSNPLDVEEDEEGVAEDQYKGPSIKKAGYKRSSINKNKVTKEDIEWGTRQSDGVAGTFNGVNFILDHGLPAQNVEAILMSEDATVSVPVPKLLRNSAMAAAGVVKADAQPFVQWLVENIEQLQPINESDTKVIDEAIATITASGDGTITVSVDGDVAVDQMGGEEGEVITEPEVGELPPEGAELGDELSGDELGGETGEDDMQPVDSVDTEMAPPAIDDEAGEMPDFEGGEEAEEPEETEEPAASPVPGEGEHEHEEDEEEGLAEDHDITDPSKSKYTQIADEDKRSDPKKAKVDSSMKDLEGIGTTPKKDDGSGTKHSPKSKK